MYTCPRPWCKYDATEPHICPYAADVEDDQESLCTCCAACEEQCAMDI